MKNQYFGDNRDLFKYDIIYQIMKSGLVKQLAFIPMLTEDDGKPHGNVTNRRQAKAGKKNKELVAFLDDCVKNGKRDIKQIGEYFAAHGIKVILYGKNFSDASRKEYFSQIANKHLVKSLVFLDPDTGLEVKSSGKEYVMFSEVKDLYERMDKNSILMVFQFLPRQPHMEYLNMRCEQLKEKITGDYPVCIDDDKIAFFFITKNEEMEHQLLHVVGDYMEKYS